MEKKEKTASGQIGYPVCVPEPVGKAIDLNA